MDAVTRIERTLSAAIGLAEGPGCPPRLAQAMRHAVFPRGARVRPRLCLAVAGACGDDAPALAEAAAASIELLHCASLVHDDLPCFDDAATRRGRPSVHAAHGEPLAVLAGDALIVLSFQLLARAAHQAPARLGAAGDDHRPFGRRAARHRRRPGLGKRAALRPGAIPAGEDRFAVRRGDRGGCRRRRRRCRDLAAARRPAGRGLSGGRRPPRRGRGRSRRWASPPARTRRTSRPSAVLQFGLSGAIARLEDLAAEAVAAIPDCPGARELRAVILSETRRLLPRKLCASAA